MRMSQGCHRCHKDNPDCFKDARDGLGRDIDKLRISITDKIRKPFMEKSPILIFL